MAKIMDDTLNKTTNGSLAEDVASPNDAEDGQEAIAYVQQLIARMGGGTASEPTTPTPAPSSSSTANTSSVEDQDDSLAENSQFQKYQQYQQPSEAEPTASEDVDDMVDHDEPEKPAAPKPQPKKATDVDSLDDMKRLREAANLTTADALHSHSCKQMIGRAYLSFFCSIFFAITSLLIKFVAGGADGVAFKGVLVCITISIVSGAYFMRLSRIIARKI